MFADRTSVGVTYKDGIGWTTTETSEMTLRYKKSQLSLKWKSH